MKPPISIPDALFGKTRQAVLALLFGNPERAYYMREIVHSAQSGASQVQKELEQMSRAGLITREPRGNHVYFQANRSAAIFAELAGLVAKTFGVADILREALGANEDRIQAAFIYGSIARGEQQAQSDVDLLVVGDVLLSDLDEGVRAAEDRIGRQVSLTVMNRKEFAKRDKEKNHFLQTILREPKIFLIGDEQRLAKFNERRAR